MRTSRALFLTLFVAISPALDSGAAETRLVAKCVNGDVCAVTGTLLVHAAGLRRVPIVRGMATLEAAGDAEIELEAAGYWMPRQRLTSSAVVVWRTTQLRGRFARQPPAKELPKSFALVVETPPGTKGATAIARGTTIDCPVAPDGSWACAAPAVPLDLILRAKTFTPQYLWDVKLAPGTPTDLGTLPLRQGASLVAWLDSNTAKALKQPAHASLVRMSMSGSPTMGDRLNVPVAEAAFNRRGVVQLAPVPPGSYTLEVTAPGFAPARLDQIQVYERSESVLRPVIRLDPPLTIRLSVEPARDPAGALWRVTLHRANELTYRRPKVAEGTVTAAGVFELPGQSPGRYFVTVTDARGNDYADRQLDIHNDADAQQTIRIPLRRLHGKVTVGRQPIQAHLLFGGNGGEEQIGADADDDGSYEVVLPRAGKWRVDIDSGKDGVVAAVTATIGNQQDELNIALPNTEISGWVTGSDGRRVNRADVIVATSAGTLSRRIDNGTFRFRGVSAGTAMISASNPKTAEHSRMVELNVAEGSRLSDVELVLRSLRTLKGTVTTQGQPLIGARVNGYGFDKGSTRQERAISGLDGGFGLSFPDSASEIVLVVAAPGRTLQAFSTPPTDKPITIDVAPDGGLLRLRMPRGTSRQHVHYNGALIPMPDLLEWARALNAPPPEDSVFNFPNLAPGLYRFCATREGRGEVCRDGLLPRGGVLLLGDG